MLKDAEAEVLLKTSSISEFPLIFGFLSCTLKNININATNHAFMQITLFNIITTMRMNKNIT